MGYSGEQGRLQSFTPSRKRVEDRKHGEGSLSKSRFRGDGRPRLFRVHQRPASRKAQVATLSTPVDGESGPDWVWPYLLYLGMRTSRAPPGSYKRSTQGWLSAATLSIWGSAGTGFFPEPQPAPISSVRDTVWWFGYPRKRVPCGHDSARHITSPASLRSDVYELPHLRRYVISRNPPA